MKVIITILLIGLNLMAGNLEKARDAMKQHDFERASTLLQPLVDDNDAEAQFLLGNIYFHEKSGAKETQHAVELYIKSAKQNNVNAQLALATVYCYVDKTKQDLQMCAYRADQARLNGKDVSRLWNHFELDKYFDSSNKEEMIKKQ